MVDVAMVTTRPVNQLGALKPKRDLLLSHFDRVRSMHNVPVTLAQNRRNPSSGTCALNTDQRFYNDYLS